LVKVGYGFKKKEGSVTHVFEEEDVFFTGAEDDVLDHLTMGSRLIISLPRTSLAAVWRA